MDYTVTKIEAIKNKVEAALERAEGLGTASIEEACRSAAQSLGIPVEVVRDVALAVEPQRKAP